MGTIEASWQQKLSEGLLLSVSVHQSDLRNLIDEAPDPDAVFGITYENRGSARTRGIELEMTARLSRSLSGYLSFADQSTVNTEHDPGNTGSLGLTNSPARTSRDTPFRMWLSP